jgi:hypothetical protein
MTRNYNITGQDRKRLVGAISEILNHPTHYNGAPTFSYYVGEFHISKTGELTGPEDENLIGALYLRGFFAAEDEIKENPKVAVYARVASAAAAEGRDEPEASTEPETDHPDRLTIEMPLEGFSPEKLENLTKLVQAKEPLLKMALGVDALPIRLLDDRIAFDWFRLCDDADFLAYAQLISAICRTAIEKQRVLAKPNESHPNMRFAMRTWLITLGLVGPEFKKIRHILTSTLSGNGAYSKGYDPRKAAKAMQEGGADDE